MSDIINLTSSVRTNLFALNRASEAREQSVRRLSTGLEVQRATDGSADFFQSQALTNRASGLFQAKDDIGQALSAVEGALDGIDALGTVTDQLRGIALAARGGSDDSRSAAAEQFDSLRRQLNNLARDTSFQGTNLIDGAADDLTVSLNETGSSSLTIEGRSSDASGLEIGSALDDFGGFASDADIDTALADLRAATSSLRSSASSFGADVATLNIREDFAQNLGSTLESGSAKLVNADLNEESARQLSSRIRQELSALNLSIAAQGSTQITQLLAAV